MEHPFRFKDPRIYRVRESDESLSDEDTQNRFKPINWWKKEKEPTYINANNDAQETNENVEEITNESTSSPRTGLDTQNNDISCSPKERKVTSSARNTFSSDSLSPPTTPNWQPQSDVSDALDRERFLSRVRPDFNNSTFNEFRGYNDVSNNKEENNSTEMTRMHKAVENQESFNAENGEYQNTAPNSSNKCNDSWLDSTKTRISEETDKETEVDYNNLNTSPPPLSLIHSERPKMPPLEPVSYRDMPPLAHNDSQTHSPERDHRPGRTYKRPYEYTHQTQNSVETSYNDVMRSNDESRYSSRESLINESYAAVDPRTKLFIETLRRRSISGRQDSEDGHGYNSSYTDHMQKLKRSLSGYYRPVIATEQYPNTNRIQNSHYPDNEVSHSKRARYKSEPDVVDKYKNQINNQLLGLRRDCTGLQREFSKPTPFYPRQSSINKTIFESFIASRNNEIRNGYPKLVDYHQNDSAGSELRRHRTQKEADIDVHGGRLIQSKNTRLDPGNYSFSVPGYRENNEEQERCLMSQTKKNSFHPLTTSNQTHSMVNTQEKKPNESKNKPATESSNKQDLNLREDIEQLYMNKFQTTPKNQPITLDFNGIDVTITGFQLIYSNSEDFKNIICNYPQHVQGHLKEMRRKMKNRVSLLAIFISFLFYHNYLTYVSKHRF